MISTGCPKCGTEIKTFKKNCPYCQEPLPEIIQQELLIRENEDKAEYARKNYILRHWYGRLSLPIAFWINGFLIGFILHGSFVLIRESIRNDPSVNAFEFNDILLNDPFINALLLVFVVIYPWQIIGIWRSAANYVEEGGRRIWAKLAQFCIILVLINHIHSFFGGVLWQWNR